MKNDINEFDRENSLLYNSSNLNELSSIRIILTKALKDNITKNIEFILSIENYSESVDKKMKKVFELLNDKDNSTIKLYVINNLLNDIKNDLITKRKKLK